MMNTLLTIIFALFFLILFPLGEIARIDIGNNIALTGIDIGVGILCIFLIFRKGVLQYAPITRPIFLFLAVYLISLLINIPHLKPNEFLVSFLYLLRLACYISLYFLIQPLDQTLKKKLSFFMLLSGILILIIGYLQYFLYPSLRNLYYLGWDVHLYRMFGSFFDPNFLGAFLVLYFLFVLDYLFKTVFIKTKICVFSVLLFTFIAIILTYSRSAYLMFFVGILTFFLFQRPSKKIIYAIGIFLGVSILSYFTFTKYSEGTNLLRINSTKARFTSSQNALIIFAKNPLLGVGFNAYRYAQQRYGLVKQPKENIVDHAGAGTDNSFLFILATTGIIGFLAYFYMLGTIILNTKTTLILSSTIALFIDACFINSLFYPFILIWLCTILGL